MIFPNNPDHPLHKHMQTRGSENEGLGHDDRGLKWMGSVEFSKLSTSIKCNKNGICICLFCVFHFSHLNVYLKFRLTLVIEDIGDPVVNDS